jgi:hypothetical protein
LQGPLVAPRQRGLIYEHIRGGLFLVGRVEDSKILLPKHPLLLSLPASQCIVLASAQSPSFSLSITFAASSTTTPATCNPSVPWFPQKVDHETGAAISDSNATLEHRFLGERSPSGRSSGSGLAWSDLHTFWDVLDLANCAHGCAVPRKGGFSRNPFTSFAVCLGLLFQMYVPERQFANTVGSVECLKWKNCWRFVAVTGEERRIFPRAKLSSICLTIADYNTLSLLMLHRRCSPCEPVGTGVFHFSRLSPPPFRAAFNAKSQLVCLH